MAKLNFMLIKKLKVYKKTIKDPLKRFIIQNLEKLDKSKKSSIRRIFKGLSSARSQNFVKFRLKLNELKLGDTLSKTDFSNLTNFVFKPQKPYLV